jgi:RNA polymerase sigma factor (sigma-70 family)
VVRARTALVAELGRLPQPDELAGRLGISTQELRDIDERCHTPTNLQEPLSGQRSRGEPLTVADGLGDDQPLPDESAEAREDAMRLHAAISRLPTREEFTIRATWFMGISTTEVAGLLGISKSRASQIRTSAMQRLRELLDKVDADPTLSRAA